MIQHSPGARPPYRRAPAWLPPLLLTALFLCFAVPAQASLTEVGSFGSNPGNLRMFKYVPDALPANAPLVVAMHGCTQSAGDYHGMSGWRKFADEWGFALLYPGQKSSNNQNNCFRWFESAHINRGQGEPLSIKQMVDRMLADHGLDQDRVYVTGLSAGGAMTDVMLATYPDVFAGGAPVAGLPYKCAESTIDAYSCMNPGKDFSPGVWGDRVRGATSHAGPWPTVSIWHGSSDSVVVPVNLTETMEQWTNVHGIDQAADVEDTVAGYPRKIFHDSQGRARVETITITGMGHGTPLDPGPGERQCGQAGAYMLDVDICSSYYIGKFWGLDNTDQEAPEAAIINPTDGAGVQGVVDFEVTATDNVGVSKVEFFINGRLHATRTATPWLVRWDTSTFPNGNNRLRARAYDEAGNSASSPEITAMVSGGVEDVTAPVVDLVYPGNEDVLSGLVTLAAKASDDFGVSRVEFFLDEQSLGQGTASGEAGPYQLEWNSSGVADGSYRIDARARDAAGNEGVSNSVTVWVDQNAPVLEETFSDRNGTGDLFDNDGWSGAFTASDRDHGIGPADSRSALGAASSGSNCATGTDTGTLKRTLSLGDSPQLSYARQLDLSATANTSYTAAFQVLVNGTVVDEKSVTYGSYSESAWVLREDLSLANWANRDVTLEFRVEAYANVCIEAYAKAWVDAIRIGNPQRDGDSVAPTVAITAPSDGATVSATVDIAADATDDVDIAKVEFYVDGVLLATDDSAPYGHGWNTTNVADGNHEVTARAYDGAGNTASERVTVTVSNGDGGEGTGGNGETVQLQVDGIAADDGYVKASADGSGAEVGAYSSLAIGRGSDGKLNRAILSFDTSAIPAGATISRAYVTVEYSSGYGDPWADPDGNTLVLDVRTGCFSSCTTETGDWSAAVDAAEVARILRFTSGSQHSGNLSAAGLEAINPDGMTQVRLRFASNQSSTAYLFIKSGAATRLTVEYTE